MSNSASAWPLSGYRIVDLTAAIAGAYTGKLLADAGAEVVMVESGQGNPLRHRSASGAALDGQDSAIFQFLASSKARVLVDPDQRLDIEFVLSLIAASDALLWTQGSTLASLPPLSPAALRAHAPNATIVSITPWGLEGPWSDRETSEAALQALAGGPMTRRQSGASASDHGWRGGRLGRRPIRRGRASFLTLADTFDRQR